MNVRERINTGYNKGAAGSAQDYNQRARNLPYHPGVEHLKPIYIS